MEHERLGRLACFIDAIKALHIVGSAKRDGDERLRLTASKECGSMRARKDLRVDRDRPHFLGAAPIYARASVQHLRAKGVVLDVANEVVNVFRVVGKFAKEFVDGFLLHELDRANARVLLVMIERFANLAFGELFDSRFDLRPELRRLPLHFVGASLLEKLFLNSDQLLNSALSDGECLDHVGFRHLERSTFDHHDRILRSGEDDIHVAVRQLLECRVEDPFLLDTSDADSGDRAHERNLRRVEGVGRGDERHHIGVILLVGGDDIDEYLDFVLEAFRKKRTNRSVDDSRLEDLRIRRPPFSLDESAGDLAGGVRLVLVLDEEGEKRERTFDVADRCCRENHCLAKLDYCGPCRLFRHAACLDDEASSGESSFDALHMCCCCLCVAQTARNRIVRRAVRSKSQISTAVQGRR